MTFEPGAHEALIEPARCGNQQAQQELWRAHRRWVAAIILAHRPKTVEVEDLLQDVAVKFVSKIHTLRDNRAFRPWLRQIAINICRGAARSSKVALRFTAQTRDDSDQAERGVIGEPTSSEATADEELEQKDFAQRILSKVLSLPATYREPLVLRCMRSLSYQQISDILDLPVTTIETRLARARRMLREEIADEQNDGFHS